ncbi:flavin reductase family protein [Massilia sp. CCM 8734]|uniref:flavin reductase family protein n=1 Tax=Massilia sp. CCM 8734 TaxID=2609283 RepID=UPI00141DFB43|nr:flavin reductase family protein [Massilia sp. CCM 8734]NHZ96250.1 hypothetical protein [Massilia sp. CCM 8734]
MQAHPPCAPSADFDSNYFRQALSQFASGVTINSFNPVSPDPRLALWSVARFECRSRSRYVEGDHMIFVGAVARCQFHPHRSLGFHRSRFIALS